MHRQSFSWRRSFLSCSFRFYEINFTQVIRKFFVEPRKRSRMFYFIVEADYFIILTICRWRKVFSVRWWNVVRNGRKLNDVEEKEKLFYWMKFLWSIENLLLHTVNRLPIQLTLYSFCACEAQVTMTRNLKRKKTLLQCCQMSCNANSHFSCSLIENCFWKCFRWAAKIDENRTGAKATTAKQRKILDWIFPILFLSNKNSVLLLYISSHCDWTKAKKMSRENGNANKMNLEWKTPKRKWNKTENAQKLKHVRCSRSNNFQVRIRLDWVMQNIKSLKGKMKLSKWK